MILRRSSIEIQAREGGIYLPEIDLWLDPRGNEDHAFISHAHADHFSRPKKAFCSPETAALLMSRFGNPAESLEVISWEEVRAMDGWEIRLLPAGHIVGSAMLHLTRLRDDATLLYTGDFKTQLSRTCRGAISRKSEVLVMETTYGKPNFVFPAREDTEAAILQFVSDTLMDGDIAVLCAYALGKAQEVAALLSEHGIKMVLHPSVLAMHEACRELGLDLPEGILWEERVPEGHVVVCPPNTIRSQKLRRLKNRRTAMVSGWGIHPSARYRYQVDEVFPLSDHADHQELLDFVDQVDPQLVYTVHGATREFAAELRTGGYTAWSLFSEDQLELDGFSAQIAVERAARVRSISEDRPLSRLNESLNQISVSSSRLRKRDLLAGLLRGISDEEMVLLLRWLSARPLQLGIGFASVRMAMLGAFGVTLPEYRRVSDQQQDPARTARILAESIEGAVHSMGPWYLTEVNTLLEDLRSCQSQLQAVGLLAEVLRKIPAAEVEFVIRVLTGEFRIGSAGGVAEEAVAVAFAAAAADVAQAHMLTGDLGESALLAKRGQLSEARLVAGTPIKVMLASPAADGEAIQSKLGGSGAFWVEDKFDGIRAQLHVSEGEVSLFSRDQRSLGQEFPEIILAGIQLPDIVLDGEIIAYEEGRRLTFFDLQKRLGRKQQHRGQGNLFHVQETPVRFLAFDLLRLGGEDLWAHSLSERRAVLESVALKPPFSLVEVDRMEGPEELEKAFKRSRARGNEGLIVKDPGSPYQFGRRGQSWLKLKKAGVTLDCVVIRAQQGHGRRAGLLSDYTFAVRDQSDNSLRVLGKAYSGLTDGEIEELTDFFEKTTIEKRRRVHDVEPLLVLEIAFDSIRASKRHDSGLALRFPRIRAIRRDKGPADIDTLQFARTLV